jgi:thiol-disulfide isomerase/thioredoxin
MDRASREHGVQQNDPGRGWEPGDDASRHARARRWRGCALATLVLLGAAAASAAPPAALPAFTHREPSSWLNSAPLEAEALRGHPVLIEVWTFECSNCLASLPWMQRVAARYRPSGLAIVGVHTPELVAERDPAQVAAAVRRLGIGYPVMLDRDFSYWQRLDNHYWPAFYLFDGSGRLLATRIGELHAGEPAADAFEQLIAAQLSAGR